MLNHPRTGPNSVPEFLVSSIPWVTSSSASGLRHYSFPFITSFFLVKNTSVTGSTNDIRVGYTELGIMSSSNYFTLTPGESFTGQLRIKDLYVSGTSATTIMVHAGLTTIPYQNMPVITGSNGFNGVG